MSANEKLTNQTLFLTQCECCVITLKCVIFIFLTVKKTNVPSSSVVFASLQNKQCLFLALSSDFSAVSAGGSEVIAASLDRQFHHSADFADLSSASLDNTIVAVLN